MAQILLTTGILILFGAITINVSGRQSKNKANQIIRDICQRLYDDGLYSDKNRKWYTLCEEWTKIKRKDHKQYEVVQDENIMDDSYMTHIIQPRKGIVGGVRFSGGGFRFSRGGIRSSVSRSSISSSRSRSRSSSSIIPFRNTRTGATIYRPNGWLWSRSRSMFLPLSTRFSHQSRPSSNHFTAPATINSSVTYYYCTSNSNTSVEIQCSSVDGDSQCCDDETTQQVFCCGSKISEDFIEHVNQATQILARIFYTLAAVTLCIHIFMRRFYQ